MAQKKQTKRIFNNMKQSSVHKVILETWSSRCGSADQEPHMTSVKMQVQSLFSPSGLRIWHCHSCSVGCRCALDLMLPWLWCRLAAVAQIRPLAWELPYAAGRAVKRKQIKQNKIKQLYWKESFLLSDQSRLPLGNLWY